MSADQAKKFALASKEDRQSKFRGSKGEPTDEAKLCATIEIQRRYRGFRTRYILQEELDSIIGKSEKPDEESDKKPKTSIARNLLDQRYKKYVTKQKATGNTDYDDFKAFCRKYSGRGKARKGSVEEEAIHIKLDQKYKKYTDKQKAAGSLDYDDYSTFSQHKMGKGKEMGQKYKEYVGKQKASGSMDYEDFATFCRGMGKSKTLLEEGVDLQEKYKEYVEKEKADGHTDYDDFATFCENYKRESIVTVWGHDSSLQHLLDKRYLEYTEEQTSHGNMDCDDFTNFCHEYIMSGKGKDDVSLQNLLQKRYSEYVEDQKADGNTVYADFSTFCQEYIGRGASKDTVAEEVLLPIMESSVPMTPREKLMKEVDAVIVIQRAWRRHIDVQVYRYYRDLINFKNRGDPAMMLRCINPKEASLLDAAIGVHIKFRLAGDRFPPNIYYKMFTHRPIQDLCANSPKDYMHADAKKKGMRTLHNKTGPKGSKGKNQDKTGWYERSENNGWRLVSDRLIHHIMSDPVTWETSNKKMQFSHNKLQRQADVQKKKKEKKIDWMRKMYKQGMMQAKVTDPDTVELIEGAAAGMVATIDARGSDAVQEWEVDELLDWTTSLNFDDYWLGWKEAATSASSAKPTDDRFQLTTSQHDPFELTVSNAGHHNNNQRQGESSTRQSHNTPASGPSIASY